MNSREFLVDIACKEKERLRPVYSQNFGFLFILSWQMNFREFLVNTVCRGEGKTKLACLIDLLYVLSLTG